MTNMNNIHQSKSCIRPYLGSLLTLLFAFLKPLDGVIKKKLSSEVSTMTLCAYRNTFQLLFIWPFIAYKTHKKEQKKRRDTQRTQTTAINFLPIPNDHYSFKMAIGKAITGNLGVLACFSAFDYLPIGDVQVFNFSSGMVTTLLAWVFLGETISLVNGISLCVTMVGCVIVSQPTTILSAVGILDQEAKTIDSENDEEHNVNIATGMLLCLTFFFLYGATNFFSRGIKQNLHWSIMLLYNSIFGVLMFWSIVIFQEKSFLPKPPPSFEDFLYMNGIGFLGMFTQGLMILCLIYESPVVVTVIGSTTIVFSYLMDLILFDENIERSSVIGSGMVIFAVVLEGYFQYRGNRRKE